METKRFTYMMFVSVCLILASAQPAKGGSYFTVWDSGGCNNATVRYSDVGVLMSMTNFTVHGSSLVKGRLLPLTTPSSAMVLPIPVFLAASAQLAAVSVGRVSLSSAKQ